jgi:transcriptional regulator with XRE-family HTH domain
MLRIKHLRLQQQMSQQQLAAKLQVAQNTVCNWENGKRSPDAEALVRLAQLFGVSVEYLLGQDEAAVLTDKEAQLLEAFRRLNARQQDRLLAAAAQDGLPK